MKFRPVEAEFFHTDGQTHMTKLVVSFCSFASAPEFDVLNKGHKIAFFFKGKALFLQTHLLPSNVRE